ncbi:hypothetical protein FRC05_007948 [Tulasnella sp. 425]|nr:hypothetical protein FRC05_007948 [Tulasnella sp. 425]
MYQVEIPADRNQRAEVLHRYIYSFCTDKILRRFNSKIPGFKPHYVSLLLPPTDSITLEEYRTYSEKEVVLPQRLASRDETRIYALLKALLPRRNVKLADKRLILDTENQWNLWECFKHFLGKAQDCLRDLQALKGIPHKIKEEEIESALAHLDGLNVAMAGIFLLTHYSPSFWIVMERMAPLLELRLGPETRGNRTPSASPTRHPEPGQDSAEYSPPSSTTQTGPGDHPSSPHSTATADADSSEWSDDDDATSDVETTRNPSRRSARKTERPEDLHDVISKSWSRVTIMIRHWMKSITQWHHGMEDLAHGRRELGILSKSLTIDVTVAPMSPLPSRQTSLIETIKSTSYSSDVEAALSILRGNATSLSLNGATGELLQALGNQDLTDEAVSEMWESGFLGGIHCEAQLAYNIVQRSSVGGADLFLSILPIIVSSNLGHECLIGVSKRCCFCCAVLLRALKVNDGDIVGHGKIYSWSPPCEASEETKQIVLKKLREKFEAYLKGCDRRGHRTPDSGSGNDSNGGLSPLLVDYLITKIKAME